MKNNYQTNRIILIASLLGAIGGGVLTVLITRAIPKMMSRMMVGMMKNWMASMKDENGNPVDT
jgi:CheY-specific phosphatase CheX